MPSVLDPPTPATPLRIYRVARGYTGRQLAALAGVTPATVSNLETRKYPPQPEVAERIGRVLQVSPAALFPDGLSKKRGVMRTATRADRYAEWNGDLSGEVDPDGEVMAEVAKHGCVWGALPY